MEKHDEKIIGKDVGQVYRQLQILVDTTLEPFEFGRGQYLYFIHIVKHPGINQEALSAMLKIDKGTTARAVRITSYNVCYTKLLRRLHIGATKENSTRTKRYLRKRYFGLLQHVITSYSIHYTKLYET